MTFNAPRFDERPDPEGLEVCLLRVREGYAMADGTLTKDRFASMTDRARHRIEAETHKAAYRALAEIEVSDLTPGPDTPSRIEWLTRAVVWGLIPGRTVDALLRGGRIDDHVWAMVRPLMVAIEPLVGTDVGWSLQLEDADGRPLPLPVAVDLRRQPEGVRPDREILEVLDAMLATGWQAEAVRGLDPPRSADRAAKGGTEVAYRLTRAVSPS